MRNLKSTLDEYVRGTIEKSTFIEKMYVEHHSALFDYAQYIKNTNVKKIEIEDDRVVMTSRDRGIRIACDYGDFRIAPVETLNFFDYEKDESSMMENLVLDGDTVFDIGANIGWYSINIAASKRAVKVYCFEPIPKTYKSLLMNIDLNGISNVYPHNFGFASQAGEFPFYYYKSGSGNASAVNLTNRTDVECVQCKVITIDEFIKTSDAKVDFIKCDVEGAELLVFRGGLETIKRDTPIVFSEILRKWSAKFNYDPNDIFRLFEGMGYQAYTAKNNFLTKFQQMDESTIETNFFFLHAEKHGNEIRRFAREA